MQETETEREEEQSNSKVFLTRRRWQEITSSMNLIGLSQIGLFIIVLFYMVHEVKAVLLPIILALLVTMILRPIYRTLRKIKLPRMLSSALTVLLLIALISFTAYQVAVPGAKWMQEVGMGTITKRMEEVFRPMTKMRADIKDVADKVEEAANADPNDAKEDAENDAEADKSKAGKGTDGEADKGTDGEELAENQLENEADESAGTEIAKTPDEKAEKEAKEKKDTKPAKEKKQKPVVVKIQDDPMTVIIDSLQDLGLGLAAFLILVLFMLAFGNQIIKSLNENSHVEVIIGKMGRDVSLYLFTITIINGVLGLFSGLAMWWLGMPNPALWGLMAMFLTYIPYVGALMGTFVVFLVAVVTFDQAGSVIQAPVIYYFLTLIEGSLVTPIVLGKRFSLNPLAVLVWVFCWAGFWGIAGMLIAMPALVIFKIICENTSTMESFQKIISSGEGKREAVDY